MNEAFDKKRVKEIANIPIDEVAKLYATFVTIRKDGFINRDNDYNMYDTDVNWDITEGLQHDLEIMRRRLRDHYRKVGAEYNSRANNK